MGRMIAWVCLASLSGCMVELSIPEGADLACEDSDECPTGFVCSASLGLCVNGGQGPAALSPAVQPQWAKVGTAVLVSFSTPGTLASEPVVQLQTTPARSLLLSDQTDDRYVFEYTAVGDESEVAFDISATLVDAEGATVTSVLGQVTFDFTAPTGSGGRVGDTYGSGDSIDQSLGVHELLGEHPSIVIASSPAVPLTLLVRDGTAYSFQHTFDGTEPPGTFSVIATLRDRAGNEGTADLGTITVAHPP